MKALLASAVILFPAIAEAQLMVCDRRTHAIERLRDKHGESLIGAGFASRAFIVEIYANDETGSWTILRTDTRGLSCVLAVGENWESYEPLKEGKPL